MSRGREAPRNGPCTPSMRASAHMATMRRPSSPPQGRLDHRQAKGEVVGLRAKYRPRCRRGATSAWQVASRFKSASESGAPHFTEPGNLVTPTRSSNMDPPALQQRRAPQLPRTTAPSAGKRGSPIARRVLHAQPRELGEQQRRQRYKDVLKEYSTVLLELGYHSSR